MSKIALTPNASGSGTFTIAAPNSDTDRTLTLPDEAGTVLTSGTDVANFPSGFANGITGMDMFRLSASYSGGTNFLTSNWERVDTDFDKIGTGMSESSGVFTFPETGIWHIQFTCRLALNGSCRGLFGDIYHTRNNSTYSLRAQNGESIGRINTNTTHGGIVTTTVFDVTDVANDKVKFRFAADDGETSTVVLGETSYNSTNVLFIRLGDT